MKKIRYLLFFGVLLSTVAAHADQTDAFYRQLVYAVGPSLDVCKSMLGVPSGLWGNRSAVEQTEVVSPDGKMLTIIGTDKRRTQTIYRFFLQRKDCLAYTRSSVTGTSSGKNADKGPVSKPTESSEDGWQVGSDTEIACEPIGKVYPGIQSPEQFGPRTQFSSPTMAIYDDPKAGPTILSKGRENCLKLLRYMRGPQNQAQMEQTARDLAKTTAPHPHTWYTATLNFDSCKQSMSPADRIHEIQEGGNRAKTRDFNNSSGALRKVEVSVELPNGDEQYWTYFRSEADCQASLPKNQPIDSKYQ